jgi:hypothetical protein
LGVHPQKNIAADLTQSLSITFKVLTEISKKTKTLSKGRFKTKTPAPFPVQGQQMLVRKRL